MGQMKKDEEVGQQEGQASKCASVSAPYQQAACSNIYFNALSHGKAKTYIKEKGEHKKKKQMKKQKMMKKKQRQNNNCTIGSQECVTDRVDQPTRQTHTHRHKLGRRPYDRPPPSVTDSGTFSLSPSHTLLLSLTGTRVLPLFCFLGALCDVDRAPLIIYICIYLLYFFLFCSGASLGFSSCVCVCVCVGFGERLRFI